MSGRSFRSLFMVASCAGAVLGCYLVSLRVASERAALENVETKIVLAQRDLRVLQTEIGTRGRLAQLERWNASALALSAPSADQFLGSSFELARLTRPDRKVDFEAPVVMASAPAASRPPIGADEATDDAGAPVVAAASGALLHQASLKTETREVPAKAAVSMPRAAAPQPSDRPVTAAKPARSSSLGKPGLAAAKSKAESTGKSTGSATLRMPSAAPDKKVVDKLTSTNSKPVTKPIRLAKIGATTAPLVKPIAKQATKPAIKPVKTLKEPAPAR